MMNHRHHEKGFTLLELLLVVGISAVLMLGVTQLTQSWVNSELSTNSGQHLQRVSNVVQKYVEAHWNLLPATNDAINHGATVVGSPWAGLLTNLDDEGLLDGANEMRNPLGFDLQISFTNTGGLFQAAIFGKTNALNQRVWSAARNAGNFGGSVSSFPDNNFATGAFGQWSIAKNSLMTSGNFPCTVTNERGCLVAIVRYTDITLQGPYLYRNDMGDTKLNTMYTDLFMNNSGNITGAADIQTTDLNVSGTANLGTTNVAGVATMNGATTVNEGMTVNNGMTVSGDATFANNVTIDTGTLNAGELNATTILAPTITTNNLDTQNLTISNGDLVVDDSISINGNVAMTGVNSEIYAGSVNAGQIDANNGKLTVGSVDVRNTLEINGDVTVTSGEIVADRIVADQCVTIMDDPSTIPPTYKKYGVNCP